MSESKRIKNLKKMKEENISGSVGGKGDIFMISNNGTMKSVNNIL